MRTPPPIVSQESGATLQSIRSFISQQGEEETQVLKQLNWLYQIKDARLSSEYYKTSTKKNGTRYLLFVTMLYTFVVLPVVISPFVQAYEETNTTQKVGILTSFIFLMLGVICAWIIGFQRSVDSLLERLQWKQLHRDRLFTCIHHGMIVFITGFFLIQFVRKTYFPFCHHAGSIVKMQFSDGSCESIETRTALLLGNALMVLSTPLFLFATMPSTRIELIWVVIAISCIVTVYIGAKLKAAVSLFQYILWIISIVLAICDIQIRNFTIFLMNRKLQATLKENERMADELHANEMRHMIGNVAHDLKTPLSSLTMGIDYIQLLVDEQRCQFDGMSIVPEALLAFINSVQSCLHNIRNTNSFMLMTINRCIDYTKASKGLKLVPRYETIDLMETLQLPISCMQSIQNRIEIKLKSMSRDICSHVITDKQWLQENVLCLLSNAVKYSSSGSVTISITFVRKSMDEMRTRDPDSDRRKNRDNNLELRIKPQSPAAEQEINFCVNTVGPSSSFMCTPSPEHRMPHRFNPSMRVHPSNDGSGKNSRPSVTIDVKKASDPPSFFMNTSPGWLLFEIEDTGIGIPEEAMSTLFNPFKQTQRLAGGTGLGLYSLAKRIESLKGTYGVKERKDGQQGSLFWFTIPYRPDEMIAMASPRDPNNNDVVVFGVPSSVTAATQATASSSGEMLGSSKPVLMPSSSKLQKLKILIVDDSPAIVKMTSMMLKKLGHEISSAENGEVAIKAVIDRWEDREEIFDVILMDLQMPVMDGLEATRRLRKMEFRALNENTFSLQSLSPKMAAKGGSSDEGNTGAGRSSFYALQIPRQIIIGMSANSDHDTTQAAYEVGVNAFLGKPFNVSTFTEVSSTLIAKQQSAKQQS